MPDLSGRSSSRRGTKLPRSLMGFEFATCSNSLRNNPTKQGSCHRVAAGVPATRWDRQAGTPAATLLKVAREDLPWHRSRLPCVSLLVFINMTLGSYLPLTTLALASCAFLGGCLSSSERHGSTPGRPPAMPTMALPTSSAAEKATESEIIANALRAARSNAFDGVVQTLR